MLPITFGVVALRALSLVLSLQGKRKEADALFTLAAGVESGANVDAHMAKVAEALKTGQQRTWDEIFNDIAPLRAQLHDTPPTPSPIEGRPTTTPVTGAGRPETLR